MKILYGVQGTGNGHISRARMMARHFNDRPDIDVTYLFSGRSRNEFFDMEIFGDYQCRRGLTFIAKRGRLSYLDTIRNNNLRRFYSEVKRLNPGSYDLVITDYEPVSAWAARLAGAPVLGLGHQYAFNHDIPREGGNRISWLLMHHFAPARDAFGLHWNSFGERILPPIVDPRLVELAVRLGTDKRKIIVYLPFENQAEVTAVLSQIPGFRFYQYAPDLTDAECQHISLRRTSHTGFTRDLCSAAGVICNAGFELVSESIQLGLKALVKPLKGQPEQISNAAALVSLNLASRVETLSLDRIEQWLDSLDRPDGNTARIAYPDVAGALVDWIGGDFSCTADRLVQLLWSGCAVPMDSGQSDMRSTNSAPGDRESVIAYQESAVDGQCQGFATQR